MDRQTKSPVIVPVNGRTNAAERTIATQQGWPDSIALALQQPGGARFYRCALQVNTPFQGHFKGFDSSHRRDSEMYKRDYALARQCKKCGIDVIGLCDHNCVGYLEIHRQIGGKGAACAVLMNRFILTIPFGTEPQRRGRERRDSKK